MHKRLFQQSPVSEVGLGTWQLGADWGPLNDTDADAILDRAIACGITFFDTADVYGLGLSEERIGALLKRCDTALTIATKMGRFPKPGWPANFSIDVMRRHVEASLERLGVDTLDLTQLHCLPWEVMEDGRIFDHLRTLKEEGLIKHFGTSVETMDEALLCLEQEGLASLQIIFNVFRQKPIDHLFAAAKAKGVALIIRLPIASGLLSGKFTQQTTFAESDHRHYNRDGGAFNVGETFAGIPFPLAVDLVEKFQSIIPSELLNVPLAQVALRWILDFDAVTTVIPGASRTDQVESNAAASNLPPLSPDFHAALRQFYQSEVAQHIRGGY